ncbi:MAG: class I SAM-dependent methyltransferase [Oligoflexia bacterium]|nr:class I SAM-dependent methyltransferase [Oligoflexia bacterium]
MKYYELHENFWQSLTSNGHKTWDRENLEDIFDTHRNRELKTFFPHIKKGKALDLGCGSGNQSFFLNKEGFECLGVDISQTAIDMALVLNEELQQDNRFIVADVCQLDLAEKFDLITDSCLLHCIVFEEHRRQFFESIKLHLNEEGKAFIFTMVTENGEDPYRENDFFFLDKDGVLWSKGAKNFDVESTTFDGEEYFPHRRILDHKKQLEELKSYGFNIIVHKTVTQKEGPSTFVALISDT